MNNNIMSAGPFLVISGHDYRSKRRASLHFIARELARLGQLRFFSAGYSVLSLLDRDPRASLWARSNIVETYNGVECYLWRSVAHPFNLRNRGLPLPERAAFQAYARFPPKILREWVSSASMIILESGISIIFFDLIKRINPRAKVIYLCSDALDVIGCARYLQDELRRIAPRLDTISVPSLKLLTEFPTDANVIYVHHGIDMVPIHPSGPSPYEGQTNIVSVGSMLFDPIVFDFAAAAFRDVTFHVIGGGRKAEALRHSNVRVYGEMPFDETVAYIAHADAGIAPYGGGRVPAYLADTSMKLLQFETHGLPAVCPDTVAAGHRGRFGYRPGDPGSIIAALRAALVHGRFEGIIPLSWKEVAARILHPEAYADTRLTL